MVWGTTHVQKYFNRQLAPSCALIAISSFNFVFDDQGYATAQAMDVFEHRFGGTREDEVMGSGSTLAFNVQWASPDLLVVCKGRLPQEVVANCLGRCHDWYFGERSVWPSNVHV
jgi:hypothetical protein